MILMLFGLDRDKELKQQQKQQPITIPYSLVHSYITNTLLRFSSQVIICSRSVLHSSHIFLSPSLLLAFNTRKGPLLQIIILKYAKYRTKVINRFSLLCFCYSLTSIIFFFANSFLLSLYFLVSFFLFRYSVVPFLILL